MTRKISAHYIYTINSAPLKNGIIEFDHNGYIVDIIDTGGNLRESERLEFFDGIITPGFVNAHTHIELSHLINTIPRGIGITGFIKEFEQIRKTGSIENAIKKAEKELMINGIVAIGDIVNTTHSIEFKLESPILSHSFIEIFATNPDKADLAYSNGLSLINEYRKNNLNHSLTPHAPYSVSENLWNKLITHTTENPVIWSIHNQESQEENELFLNKTGKFPEILEKFSPSFRETWKAPGMSSLKYIAQYFNIPEKILLVHNTFTSKEDLESLNSYKEKIVFVLCPKSNLYIENALPNAKLIDQMGYKIAIGTDSLASNNNLSILEEMFILQEECSIPFDKIIKWTTFNGANALGFNKQIGSIEPGKKPGLNLISHFNYTEKKLTSKSRVQVIA
jgi:cytosine/adenosine deaminase-related metal-dependent hydrolase